MTRVHANYLNVDGTPATGTVKFKPSVTSVLEDDSIVYGPTEVPLVNGRINVELTATDETNPEGWTYRVTERIDGRRWRAFNIQLSEDVESINLADVIPVEDISIVSPYILREGSYIIRSISATPPDTTGWVEGDIWINTTADYVVDSGDEMTGTLTINTAPSNDLALEIGPATVGEPTFQLYSGGYMIWDFPSDPNIEFWGADGRINMVGDMAMNSALSGLILKDRTTATEYRLFVDNGVLEIEAV